MAVDEALMESVRVGGTPVLRFYRWAPACLSLGRNQPAAGLYDEPLIRRRGWDVVRRPTGGRAVLHDRELTYAAVMPERALGSPRESYATVNQALVRGLRRLGIAAELQPRTGARAPVPSLAPCFRDPAEGEVMVDGRKLVGSAQCREHGVVLQHGSLLLAGSQAAVGDALREPAPLAPEDEPALLGDFLDPLPAWSDLVGALVAGWGEVVGALAPSALTAADRDRADKVARRYADPAWTWRR